MNEIKGNFEMFTFGLQTVKPRRGCITNLNPYILQ